MDQVSNTPFADHGDDDAMAQRNDSRDSLFLVAQLRIENRPGSSQVRVRNLSTGGMMAEYDQPIEIGTAIEADIRGVGKVLGEVAWTAAGRIGVSFESPINPMAARKPVAAKPEPVKAKPIKPIL